MAKALPLSISQQTQRQQYQLIQYLPPRALPSYQNNRLYLPHTSPKASSHWLLLFRNRGQKISLQRVRPAAVLVASLTVQSEEYCQQLRNNIRQHRATPNDNYRCIDTCDFWKDQCAKLYEEKKILEDKVRRLEEMQQTQGRVGDSKGDDLVVLNAHGKRPPTTELMETFSDVNLEDLFPGDSNRLMLSRYSKFPLSVRGRFLDNN